MANFAAIMQENEITLTVDNPPFSYHHPNMTNRVLIQQFKSKVKNGKSDAILFIPCYVWINLHKFTSLDLSNLQGEVNITLNIVLNLKDLPKALCDTILNKLIVRFNRDEPINLGDKAMVEIKSEEIEPGIIKFTVIKIIKTGIFGDIFSTPFEVINLILSVTLQQRQFTIQQVSNRESQDMELFKKFKNFKVIFNCMDINKDKFGKVSYGDENSFGKFDLAETKIHTEYSDKEIPRLIKDHNTKKKSANEYQKDFFAVKQFCFAHFILPLYRFPCASVFAIYFPLWLLGVIGLGIFFQDTGLADRLGSLAGLMIGYVALLPNIREQLPPSPNITLVEIFVYLQIMMTTLCYAESLIVRQDESYQFLWSENGFFLAAMIIQIVQVFVVVVLFIIYLIKKNFYYNRYKDLEPSSNFDAGSYQEWYNEKCDDFYRRKIDSRDIKVLNFFIHHSK